MAQWEKWLGKFNNALDAGAGDNELEGIIDEACDALEDDMEYCLFYEGAQRLYRG